MRLIGLCVRHVIMPIRVRSRGRATCPVGKKRKNVDHVSIFRGAPAYPGGVTGRGLFYKPPGGPFYRFTFLGFALGGARN